MCSKSLTSWQERRRGGEKHEAHFFGRWYLWEVFEWEVVWQFSEGVRRLELDSQEAKLRHGGV